MVDDDDSGFDHEKSINFPGFEKVPTVTVSIATFYKRRTSEQKLKESRKSKFAVEWGIEAKVWGVTNSNAYIFTRSSATTTVAVSWIACAGL